MKHFILAILLVGMTRYHGSRAESGKASAAGECLVEQREIQIPSNDGELEKFCQSLTKIHNCFTAQSLNPSLNPKQKSFLTQQATEFQQNFNETCSDSQRRSEFLTKFSCYCPKNLAEVIRECRARFVVTAEVVARMEGSDRVVGMCGAALTTRDCLVHNIRAMAVDAQGCVDGRQQTALVGKHMHVMKVLFINQASHETLLAFNKLLTNKSEVLCPEESSWQEWYPNVPEYGRHEFDKVFLKLQNQSEDGSQQNPGKAIDIFLNLLA